MTRTRNSKEKQWTKGMSKITSSLLCHSGNDSTMLTYTAVIESKKTRTQELVTNRNDDNWKRKDKEF